MYSLHNYIIFLSVIFVLAIVTFHSKAFQSHHNNNNVEINEKGTRIFSVLHNINLRNALHESCHGGQSSEFPLIIKKVSPLLWELNYLVRQEGRQQLKKGQTS